MRDVWTRRIGFLLFGGLIGVYTPEGARYAVLGAFLWFGLGIGLWKPRDFLGSTIRPEVFVLFAGAFMGLLVGFTGGSSLERPLIVNSVQVTGELEDWSVNSDKATGSLRILEPIFLEGTSDSTQSEFQNKKYRLSVYPNAEGELPKGWQSVQPGDVLSFKAKLEHPKPPGTEGQFNLPLYYAVRGFSGGLTARGDAEIDTPGDPPLSWSVRKHVRELLERIFSTQKGVLEGILFGDTSQVPDEDLERYRITGVYHVFSASGSNVAFLLTLCWGVLRFLPGPLRVGSSISVLVFYALLCGANPPILRATVMGIFVLLGRLGSGRGNSLRGLFLAALFLFIWQPLNLRDIGFQLSFMATWGIIVLGPRLVKFRRIQRLPRPIKVAFATTCAAQMTTFPLLILAFHRFSLIGLLANLGVLFILGSIFELGIMGVVFSFLPILALPLFQVSLWLLSVTDQLLFLLSQIPLADAWVINPGMLFWMGWYGGIIFLLIGEKRVLFTLRVWAMNIRSSLEPVGQRVWSAISGLFPRDCLRGQLCRSTLSLFQRVGLNTLFSSPGGRFSGFRGERLVLVLMILLILWSPWNRPRVLEVTFIDVGQGDSILIETSQGKRVLVDTGPKTERFDAGEKIVLPFLLQKGINHLDALILTHAHSDHVGGAAALLETIPVDWVGVPESGRDWVGGEGLEDEVSAGSGWGEESGLDQELVMRLANQEIKTLLAGDQVLLDPETQLKVLGPVVPLSGTHSDENNNSLVLSLENQGGLRVLLTADMEQEEMEEIRKAGQEFSADLFKVPHHGSRFSLVPEWLDQITPQAVVIPVGRNSFGHPNAGVLQYWEDRQVPIYRTDEDGTIQVRISEKGITVIPGR